MLSEAAVFYVTIHHFKEYISKIMIGSLRSHAVNAESCKKLSSALAKRGNSPLNLWVGDKHTDCSVWVHVWSIASFKCCVDPTYVCVCRWWASTACVGPRRWRRSYAKRSRGTATPWSCVKTCILTSTSSQVAQKDQIIPLLLLIKWSFLQSQIRPQTTFYH